MKKTFILDTNVLLIDPDSILKFPDNHVVIPVTVLEELSQMKRLPNELGKHSRMVFQLLNTLVRAGKGDLHQGLKLDNGAILRIQLHSKPTMLGDLTPSIRDNRILMSALFLQEQGEAVVFVSKDLAVRIKAEAIGLEAQDYENLKFSYEALYQGVRQIEVTKREVDEFFKDGVLKMEVNGWRPNEYCIMKSPENSSAVGKYNVAEKALKPLIKFSDLWGVRPRNIEQKCAVDLLLRDDVKLVTLMGQAGTGKTLLALACGMRKVFDENQYMRILISRPVVPLGRDIGFLPGTKEDKLFHWMQPIYDNLEYLCSSSDGSGSSDTLQWVMDSKKIEMEAVTYIRGRSLPKAYIIVDEAQNLTPHEMKTIISRAGEGTKVVLTGDPSQIDNPYLDKDSNGLTYTVGRFSDHKLFGHVYLSKTERSELAALAAELL